MWPVHCVHIALTCLKAAVTVATCFQAKAFLSLDSKCSDEKSMACKRFQHKQFQSILYAIEGLLPLI